MYLSSVSISILAIAAMMSFPDSITRAKSQEANPSYPWCLQANDYDATRTCAFQTFDQCKVKLITDGSYCFANPYYDPALNPYESRQFSLVRHPGD
jgi:hypothetical protein